MERRPHGPDFATENKVTQRIHGRSRLKQLWSLFFIAGLAVWSPSLIAQQSSGAELPAMEIAYCSARPQKPPLKTLFFNVTLHNRSDHARWFLLPRALYDQPVALTKRSIDAVEVHSAPAPNRLILADFMGTLQLQPESAGGFQGFFLPAGANLTVRSLNIGLMLPQTTGKQAIANNPKTNGQD